MVTVVQGWAATNARIRCLQSFNRAHSYTHNPANFLGIDPSQPTNTKHTHSIPSYWKVPFSMKFLGLRCVPRATLHVSLCLKTSSLDPNRVSFCLFIWKVMVICMCSAWVTTIWWELHFEKLFTPLLESKLSHFGLHENVLFADSSKTKPCELRLNEAGICTIYCELQFNLMQYLQKLDVFWRKSLQIV